MNDTCSGFVTISVVNILKTASTPTASSMKLHENVDVGVCGDMLCMGVGIEQENTR